MIKLKDDTINLSNLAPQMMIPIIVASEIYKEFGEEAVITSANDGRHSKSSLHYSGHAIDLRTRNLLTPRLVANHIKMKLNQDYDVVLESNHIHIEYQPKRR